MAECDETRLTAWAADRVSLDEYCVRYHIIVVAECDETRLTAWAAVSVSLDEYCVRYHIIVVAECDETHLTDLQEVKDTLDKKVVLALMAECYEMHQPDKQKIEELKASAEPQIPGLTPVPTGSTSALAAARNLAFKGSFLTTVMVVLLLTVTCDSLGNFSISSFVFECEL